MAILWRNSMSVANNEIDRDHRYLICLINTIELVLQKPDEKEPILSVLSQLKDYTQDHFKREELLQLKIKYPKFQQHKQAHNSLIIELDKMIDSINGLVRKPISKQQSEDLMGMMRSWLIGHVIEEDLPLKPYFSKFSPTLI